MAISSCFSYVMGENKVSFHSFLKLSAIILYIDTYFSYTYNINIINFEFNKIFYTTSIINVIIFIFLFLWIYTLFISIINYIYFIIKVRFLKEKNIDINTEIKLEELKVHAQITNNYTLYKEYEEDKKSTYENHNISQNCMLLVIISVLNIICGYIYYPTILTYIFKNHYLLSILIIVHLLLILYIWKKSLDFIYDKHTCPKKLLGDIDKS